MVTLTDSNFEELVYNSKEPWLVEFFAPWCGHCKNLAPEFAQAASELKGTFKLGALDATAHTIIASRFGVKKTDKNIVLHFQKLGYQVEFVLLQSFLQNADSFAVQ